MDSVRARRPKTFRELAEAAESQVPTGLLAYSTEYLAADAAESITELHRRVARDLVGSASSARTERVAQLLSKLK